MREIKEGVTGSRIKVIDIGVVGIKIDSAIGRIKGAAGAIPCIRYRNIESGVI